MIWYNDTNTVDTLLKIWLKTFASPSSKMCFLRFEIVILILEMKKLMSKWFSDVFLLFPSIFLKCFVCQVDEAIKNLKVSILNNFKRLLPWTIFLKLTKVMILHLHFLTSQGFLNPHVNYSPIGRVNNTYFFFIPDY